MTDLGYIKSVERKLDRAIERGTRAAMRDGDVDPSWSTAAKHGDWDTRRKTALELWEKAAKAAREAVSGLQDLLSPQYASKVKRDDVVKLRDGMRAQYTYCRSQIDKIRGPIKVF